jgi:hypothetical protein
MATGTGKQDIVLIAIIIMVVVIFYLFLYFQNDLFPPPLDSGPSPLPPQPIGVIPQSQSTNVGESVTISIVNSDAVDLYGFQFDVNYDPNILEFQSVEEGDFLKSDGAPTYCLDYKTDNPGLIKNIVCLRLGKVGGVTGSGVLSKITFIAKSSGKSDMQLTNVKLSDINAEVLRPETSGGEIIVG